MQHGQYAYFMLLPLARVINLGYFRHAHTVSTGSLVSRRIQGLDHAPHVAEPALASTSTYAMP